MLLLLCFFFSLKQITRPSQEDKTDDKNEEDKSEKSEKKEDEEKKEEEEKDEKEDSKYVSWFVPLFSFELNWPQFTLLPQLHCEISKATYPLKVWV